MTASSRRAPWTARSREYTPRREDAENHPCERLRCGRHRSRDGASGRGFRRPRHSPSACSGATASSSRSRRSTESDGAIRGRRRPSISRCRSDCARSLPGGGDRAKKALESWQALLVPSADAPRTLNVVQPDWVEAHCERQIGLRTDYVPAAVVPPRTTQPYPKDGVAVSPPHAVEPIAIVPPLGPDAQALTAGAARRLQPIRARPRGPVRACDQAPRTRRRRADGRGRVRVRRRAARLLCRGDAAVPRARPTARNARRWPSAPDGSSAKAARSGRC